MKLSLASSSLSVRERLIQEYRQWVKDGKRKPPTAKLLAGMYSVLYQRRYKMFPITPIQDDIESFEAFLKIIRQDISIAPFCLDVLFSLQDFNMKASAFANSKVIDKWGVIERAHKLKKGRGGVGEQAEYKSNRSGFGVVRV